MQTSTSSKSSFRLQRKHMDKYGIYKNADSSRARELVRELNRHGIDALYHLTDESNLESIKKHGLLSYEEQKKRGISFFYSVATDDSRYIDSRYGYSSYIHLSFSKEHPIFYVAVSDKRILKPVLLKIPLDYLFVDGVKACDRVVNTKGAKCFDIWSIPKRIKLISFYKEARDMVPMKLLKEDWKAEVLVPCKIKAEDIVTVPIGNLYFRK